MRYVLIVLLLSGCALRDELTAHHIAAKGPQCEKMGFTPNTDAFRNCQLQLYQVDAGAASAASAAAIQSRPKTCTTFGANTTCY